MSKLFPLAPLEWVMDLAFCVFVSGLMDLLLPVALALLSRLAARHLFPPVELVNSHDPHHIHLMHLEKLCIPCLDAVIAMLRQGQVPKRVHGWNTLTVSVQRRTRGRRD